MKSGSFHLLREALLRMYKKHDSLVQKPNHECNLCNYTFSIKEVLVMHMHKERNGGAHVQKSCNMCLFTAHMVRNNQDWYPYINLSLFFVENIQKHQFFLEKFIGQWILDGDGQGIAKDIKKKSFSKRNKKW